MTDKERAYFRARAEQEIAAAQTAGHPDAVRAHYQLAGYYLDLAFNPGAAPVAAGDRLEAEADTPVTGQAAFA
jgi:hypothetical protein